MTTIEAEDIVVVSATPDINVALVERESVHVVTVGESGPPGPTGPAGSGGGGTWGSITGTLSAQTDLQAALDGKSATGHIHDDRYYTETEITTFLAGKADLVHGHAIADVTGLQTALDGKAALSHNHSASEITSGTLALARGGTGASLADPDADRILFWDDSAGQITFLTLGTNLTITGTTLDAAGSAHPDPHLLGDGSASGPTYSFSGDTNTGIYRVGTDTLGITTGGVERWRVIADYELRGPAAASSSSDGATSIIRAGPGGSSSGNGGQLELRSGIPVSGRGGHIQIVATAGVGSDKAGGNITISGGASTGTGVGGNLSMSAGNAAGTGDGGTIIFSGGGSVSGTAGGTTISAGSGVTGGAITFSGGSGTTGHGTDIIFRAGPSTSGRKGDVLFLRYDALAYILKLNGTDQHLSHMGTSPTITAGGGTSPAIVGTDEAFTVTIGTGGVATSFEVTFANAFTNAPVVPMPCSDTDQITFKVASTTTKVTVTGAAAFTAGSKVHVICRGWE